MSALHLFDPDAAPEGHGITLSETVRLYLAWLQTRVAAGEFSRGRRDLTSRYLLSFLAHAGEGTPVSTCKQHHFTAWWMDGFDRWKSDYSKRDAKDAVLACFRWAQEEELIEFSPFRSPRRFRLQTKPRSPLRKEHYLTLMREATTSFVRRPQRADLPEFARRRRKGSLALRLGCFFLRHTGARPCEMREAVWTDMDWQSGIIRLFEHKTARATGKARLIGLTRRLLKLLRRRFDRLRPAGEEHIFANAEGTPWTKDTWCRHFRRHARRAALPIELTSYCLRHGFITEGIESGVDQKWIADQVGHKGTRMIERYAATTRENAAHLSRVVEAVQRRERKPQPRKPSTAENTPLFDGLD